MQHQNRITIAIDGYSSCGKSTLAKALAKSLGYAYIDSGAMYRAVALYAYNNGIINTEGEFEKDTLIAALPNINIGFEFNVVLQKSETILNGQNVEERIRQLDISNIVSPISAVKEVRTKLVELQRSYDEDKGLVMDGRDIGTNVFPAAELKLFMTAAFHTRVQRRFDELAAKGETITMAEIGHNLEERDRIDTTRVDNPLTKAPDAVVLDNTYMTRDEQLVFALQQALDKGALVPVLN